MCFGPLIRPNRSSACDWAEAGKDRWTGGQWDRQADRQWNKQNTE